MISNAQDYELAYEQATVLALRLDEAEQSTDHPFKVEYIQGLREALDAVEREIEAYELEHEID